MSWSRTHFSSCWPFPRDTNPLRPSQWQALDPLSRHRHAWQVESASAPSRSVSRWAWVLFLFSKALWMTNYEIKVKLNKQDANVQWARRRQMYRQEWIGRGTVCLCQVETTDCQSGDQLQQKLQQKFYKQLIQVQSDTFIRGPNGLLLRLSNYIKLWLGRESKFSHMG